jgi:bifunctional oligoribonuclease and PAP phosphatase NrnA
VDPRAPSVSFMLLQLMTAIGESPTTEEAELLSLALATDTGFFRHVEAGRGPLFEAAARLSNAGASFKEIYHTVYGGRGLASRRLLGRLLSRVDSHYNGKFLLTYATLKDLKELQVTAQDSDSLYMLLQSVESCEAVVLLRQEDQDHYSVGLRSNGTIDVGKIASAEGGGGHPGAAGFLSPLPRERLIQHLLEIFADFF